MAEGQAPPKIFYYFYGDNPFAMEGALQRMRAQLEGKSDTTLNHNRFSARDLSFGSLVETATTAPFLGQRRLIEVHDAGEMLRRKDQREAFLDLLDNLPQTTALVLVHELDLSRGHALNKFQQGSELLQWISAHKDRAFEKLFQLPQGSALAGWLVKHVEDLDGTIDQDAARLLGEYVNGDPYLAHQEALKLLDFTDRARPINRQDVELQTPFYSQSDVFAMVDALGQRGLSEALGHLHRLLADEDPRYAFAMIVRQFRMLLIARSAIDTGQDTGQALDAHPFVVRKVTAQADNFDLQRLERVYRRLFQIDIDSKTGQADLETELDRLIVDLAQ